ncbi:MAG: cell envelope integrity protein TolA [Galactobacter sp.]
MLSVFHRRAWPTALALIGAVMISGFTLPSAPAAQAAPTHPSAVNPPQQVVPAANDDCIVGPSPALTESGVSDQFNNDIGLIDSKPICGEREKEKESAPAKSQEDKDTDRRKKHQGSSDSSRSAGSGASGQCAEVPEPPEDASAEVLADIASQKNAQRACLDGGASSSGSKASSETGPGTGGRPADSSSSSDSSGSSSSSASSSSSGSDSGSSGGSKKCKGTDVPDKHGICASSFSRLAINRGDVGDPLIMASGMLLDLGWSGVYMLFDGDVHLIDWIYGFTWIDWLADVIKPITDNVSTFLNKFGLAPFALSLSALVYAVLWFRGHRSKAISGLFAVALVASMATIFTNPTEKFLGDNGAFGKFKDVGNELVVAATTTGDGESYTPGAGEASNNVMLEHAVGPQMVETMLRGPNQVISFGKVFKGKCVENYNEALRDSKNLTTDNNTRMEARDCDKAAEEFNKGNNYSRFGTLIGVFVLYAGFSVLLWGVFALLLYNLFITLLHIVTLAWKLLRGLFPGGAPTDVLHSLIAITLSLFMIAVSGLFLAIALIAAQAMITGLLNLGTWVYGIIGWAFMTMLVVFAIMWFRAHKAHRRLGDRLRQAMKSQTQAKGPSLPQRLTRGARQVGQYRQQRRMLNTMREGTGRGVRGGSAGGSLMRRAIRRIPGPIGAIGTAATLVKRGLTRKSKPNAQAPQTTAAPQPQAGSKTSTGSRYSTSDTTGVELDPNTTTSDTEPDTTDTDPTPEPEHTSPQTQRTRSLKGSLTTIAKRNPTAAVMIKAGSSLRDANNTPGTRRQRAAAIAAQAKTEAKRWKDPIQRSHAKTDAMREHLNTVAAKQEHKAAHKARKTAERQRHQDEKAQVRTKKDQARQVANEFATNRANLPAYDPTHEQQAKAARERINTLTGAEKRQAIYEQRLAEAEYRQQRLEQAKTQAENTVATKHTTTEPVRRP